MGKDIEYSLFRAFVRISTLILVFFLLIFFTVNFFSSDSTSNQQSGDFISQERNIQVHGELMIDDSTIRVNNFNITPTSLLTFYVSNSLNTRDLELGSTRIHSGNLRFERPEGQFRFLKVYNQENQFLAYAEIR